MSFNLQTRVNNLEQLSNNTQAEVNTIKTTLTGYETEFNSKTINCDNNINGDILISSPLSTIQITDQSGLNGSYMNINRVLTPNLAATNNLDVCGNGTILGNLDISGEARNQGERIATSAGYRWTTRNSAVDNVWTSVCYGNGLFTAVSNTGTNNRVMTSPDAINWTSRTSASNNNWSSICYGNGIFAAVAQSGTNNRAMSSPDGITWTSRTTPADNNWTSVCYGIGTFVAVSNSGTNNRVMSSLDATTWTIRTSAANNDWNSVCYGRNLFVAVSSTGIGNRVMTSSDGSTWVIRNSAADNNWNSVCYGNGLFVAVGFSNTNNGAMTSSDGLNWTLRTTPTNNNWNSVCYGYGLFCAVSTDGGNNHIMTSSDGISWTLRNTFDNNWWSICYGNGLFVSVSQTGIGNRVLTSGFTKINETNLQNNNILQGAQTMRSTLNVAGATTLSSTLGVTGATTLTSLAASTTARINGATDLCGNLRVLGTTDISGATTIRNTLGVLGSVDLSSNLIVRGGTSLRGTVDISDRLAVNIIESIGNTINIGSNSNCSQIEIGNSSSVQTINFGNGLGVTTINLGYGNDIINVGGSLNWIKSQDLQVDDRTILLNANSQGSGTGRDAGIFVRDACNNMASYMKTSSSGLGFDFKPPESAFIVSIPQATANTNVLLQNNNLSDISATQARNNLGLGSISLLNSVDINSNTSSTLNLDRGGTGVNSFTPGYIKYDLSANNLSSISKIPISDISGYNGSQWVDTSGSLQYSGNDVSIKKGVPEYQFISGDGSVIYRLQANIGNGGADFGFNILDGSLNRFAILQNGNIGIGTTITNDKLEIAGSLKVGGSTTLPDYLINLGRYGTVGGTRAGYIFGDSSGNMNILNQEGGRLTLGTNNNSSIILQNNGFLGIGTSPSAPLHISNGSTSGFIHSLYSFLPNLTAGNENANLFVFGKAPTSRNSSYIAHNQIGDDSTSNFMSIGMWGSDNILRADFNGNVFVRNNFSFKNNNSLPAYPIGSLYDSNMRVIHGSVNLNTGLIVEGVGFTASMNLGYLTITFNTAFNSGKNEPTINLTVKYPVASFVVPTLNSVSNTSFTCCATQGNNTPIVIFNSNPYIMHFVAIGEVALSF